MELVDNRYIEFSGHAMENVVELSGATFHNQALRGAGGVAVIYRNFAAKNTFKAHDIDIYGSLQNWVVVSISSFRIPQAITLFN